jgi:hypothetical protein
MHSLTSLLFEYYFIPFRFRNIHFYIRFRYISIHSDLPLCKGNFHISLSLSGTANLYSPCLITDCFFALWIKQFFFLFPDKFLTFLFFFSTNSSPCVAGRACQSQLRRQQKTMGLFLNIQYIQLPPVVIFEKKKIHIVSFYKHFNINSNHFSDELKLPVCVGEKMWKTNPYCQFALVILLQGLFFPTLR